MTYWSCSPIYSMDGSKFTLILSQDQGKGLESYGHLTLLFQSENSLVVAFIKCKLIFTVTLYNVFSSFGYYGAIYM